MITVTCDICAEDIPTGHIDAFIGLMRSAEMSQSLSRIQSFYTPIGDVPKMEICESCAKKASDLNDFLFNSLKHRYAPKLQEPVLVLAGKLFAAELFVKIPSNVHSDKILLENIIRRLEQVIDFTPNTFVGRTENKSGK